MTCSDRGCHADPFRRPPLHVPALLEPPLGTTSQARGILGISWLVAYWRRDVG